MWVNGVKFTDYPTTLPRFADGYLALQVHGGLESAGQELGGRRRSTGGETDYTSATSGFRNIRIKEVR